MAISLGLDLFTGGDVDPVESPPILWSSFFAGAYQILQTDIGLTLGGTMLHTAGSGPVITLTGTLSGTPTSIVVTCPTTGGARGAWLGVVTYRDGTTQAFTSAATVALTGLGAGVTLNIATGTAVTTDVWKATCAQLTDQVTSGTKHAIQATAGSQPVITPGLNGCAGIVGDGVDDILTTAALNLPAPGTTPYYVFAVFRYLSTAGTGDFLLGNGDFTVSNMLGAPSGTVLRQNNPSAINGVFTLNNWYIAEIKRSNNAGDTYKIGGATVTGNAGNNAVTAGAIFGCPGVGSNANAELLCLVYTPNLPDWAAVRAAVTAKYSVSVAV